MSPPIGNGDNPNQFFVFAFTDTDLPFFEPQRFREPRDDDRDDDHGHDGDHDRRRW
jgi:hypothetical protein